MTEWWIFYASADSQVDKQIALQLIGAQNTKVDIRIELHIQKSQILMSPTLIAKFVQAVMYLSVNFSGSYRT